MALSPAERETVTTSNDEDDFLFVVTHQTWRYRELKKNPLFECLREGQDGRTKWGEFRGPAWALTFLNKEKSA